MINLKKRHYMQRSANERANSHAHNSNYRSDDEQNPYLDRGVRQSSTPVNIDESKEINIDAGKGIEEPTNKSRNNRTRPPF